MGTVRGPRVASGKCKGSTVVHISAAGVPRGAAGVPSGDAGVSMGAAGRPRVLQGYSKFPTDWKFPSIRLFLQLQSRSGGWKGATSTYEVIHDQTMHFTNKGINFANDPNISQVVNTLVFCLM